ncbi:MAG TPA: excisionase family DNA-binding protein [Bacillales bacterium]|uniref:helix-turn-helix domain-containing protein n=1 Tax=Alcaligenes TaxID=507 RepID=UPI000F68BED0|nr:MULTISPECIES: helix-turn-helix domain-containing protein [Alcaligenes]QXR34737.1 excisionase family DNA-binding protein [Alcaligenes aquatilis]UYY86036.1 excisionase family DNA-binding protein [Alcaligenes sp. SMD-FA]HHW39515.1 excisionase family DNA-binding protein [Bacillales bacterium]
MNDAVYSTRQAADLLGVSVRTVQLWVEAGTLKAWKTQGGHRRIDRDSVQTILQERQGRGNAQLPDAPTPSSLPVGNDEPCLRVLVVEDDLDLLAIYRMAMEHLPFPIELRCEQDGLKGLIAAGNFYPDVLIVDLNLPKLDGFAMLKALADAPETGHTQIYVISALSATDIHARGGLPGNATALAKPIPIALLLQLLSEAFHAQYLPS